MASPKDNLSQVAGPDSMAMPASGTALQPTTSAPAGSGAPKKKKHRAGKKRRTKQQSFAGPSEGAGEGAQGRSSGGVQQTAPFYNLQQGNHSNTSLESEALLDHREHAPLRPRRQSLRESGFTRPSLPFARHRGSVNSAAPPPSQHRSRLGQATGTAISEGEEEDNAHDRTPLLASSARNRSQRPEASRNNSGHYGGTGRGRRSSVHSKSSSRWRLDTSNLQPYVEEDSDYDVNNPPSVPTSPQIGSMDDMMINELPGNSSQRGRETVIDIDVDDRRFSDTSPETQRRRATVADLAEMDVCFPGDGLSELGEDEEHHSATESNRLERRRTRTHRWPDLSILEDWAREEKEERTHQEHVRAKKINEPVFVGGRLRPGKTVWHREEDDAPFRFTYFNEMFDGTVHARTISDLLQEGATFKDLFLPDPVELEDESDEEEDESHLERPAMHPHASGPPLNGRVLGGQQSKHTSIHGDANDKRSPAGSKIGTRSNTPTGQHSSTPTPAQYQSKQKRFGPRPTFWLDVLQPTDMEMKVLAKAFGIHQLTTEDILMEEQREKVELFQHYYFLNYRSFEQDKDSDDYMDPVNFYVVVFRDGVITFHHSMTPHPANVRRRIRQLNDYMSPTADWISYALIDDVTDVYAPRVSQIENEVDDIDEEILYLHVTSADEADRKPGDTTDKEKAKDEGEKPSGGDMLRRVGECRKKVMGLYRLLGNKADVIKGFAKRCNENWEVAPRSEIGLYLGDIQDHIITMNNNLSHYER